MLSDVRDGLVHDVGLSPDRVQTEAFSAAQARLTPAADGSGTVLIRHGGDGRAVTAASGQTILDAGLLGVVLMVNDPVGMNALGEDDQGAGVINTTERWAARSGSRR